MSLDMQASVAWKLLYLCVCVMGVGVCVPNLKSW